MDKELYLGEFEELVLMAVVRLQKEAYGVNIRKTVEDVAGRFTSLGAIYTTLDRLEQKGFLSSKQGDPTPERGGRAKRYFKIEGLGLRALAEVEQVRRRMLEGIDLSFEPSGGRV